LRPDAPEIAEPHGAATVATPPGHRKALARGRAAKV